MDVFEELIQTIEEGAIDNRAEITNVKLFVKSWRQRAEAINKNSVIPDVIECECDTDNYTKHETKSGIVIYKCHNCGGCI